VIRPIPRSEKSVSKITIPPNTQRSSVPAFVTTGIMAFLSACR
jgi:hypothetical protein